ncbi:hypothetical protein JB92DRAFT_828234 [Gautieria morchelliformis]|nr:hypothetical protein JB92DRAFT_828234 [Gautieria morchelliformis]
MLPVHIGHSLDHYFQVRPHAGGMCTSLRVQCGLPISYKHWCLLYMVYSILAPHAVVLQPEIDPFDMISTVLW